MRVGTSPNALRLIGFVCLSGILLLHTRAADAITTYVQPDYEALYGVTFVDDLHGWAVGRNSVIFMTEDGGETWVNQYRIKLENDRALHSVAFSDLYHGVAVGFGGMVLFTDDGGRHWTPTVRFFEDTRATGQKRISREKEWFARFRMEMERACRDARQRVEKEENANKKKGRASGRSGRGKEDGKASQGEVGTNEVAAVLPECERLDRADEEFTSELAWLEKLASAPQPISVWSVQKMDFTSVQSLGGSIFLATANNTFYTSSDGGATWITLPRQPGNARAAWFTDAKTGWVVGYGGYVAITTDGGLTWTERSVPEPSILTAVFFADDGTGWVASETGDLFATIDGGRSWKKVRTRVGEPIREIVFLDDGVGLMTTWNGVWRSLDGGETWDLVALPEDASFWQEEAPVMEAPILMAVARAGDSSILIAGTWGIVLRSEDRARTWREIRSYSKAIVEKRRRQMDLLRSRWGFNIDVGYVQPAGDISDRFGPGVTVGFELLGLPGRFKVGVAFFMHATLFKDRMVAPEDETESGERLRLDGSGLCIMVPLITQVMFVQTKRVALFGTLGVGYVYNGFNMAEESELQLKSESGYKRKRKGVGALQSLTIMWVYPNGGPVRKSFSKGGIFLRIGLQESWTWNVDGLQTDLGTRDTADFGTEFWPRLVFGISLYE